MWHWIAIVQILKFMSFQAITHFCEVKKWIWLGNKTYLLTKRELQSPVTLQTKNTGNLPVHSSVQEGYRSHPEWLLPVTSWYTSVMLLYTNVPEGYQSLPVGYWKFET